MSITPEQQRLLASLPATAWREGGDLAKSSKTPRAEIESLLAELRSLGLVRSHSVSMACLWQRVL